jgi:hypothetical protein
MGFPFHASLLLQMFQAEAFFVCSYAYGFYYSHQGCATLCEGGVPRKYLQRGRPRLCVDEHDSQDEARQARHTPNL